MSHQLETIIGYKFKNPKLLETALTHTSYANESRTPVQHNERLEFLGDSVLQIVSADYLFHAYADRPEGDLTRIRASLVSEGALFQFAQEIDLGEYLRLGRGEERCGGRTRPSVVSDAFEALIAALYLDGGMDVARSFILPFITTRAAPRSSTTSGWNFWATACCRSSRQTICSTPMPTGRRAI